MPVSTAPASASTDAEAIWSEFHEGLLGFIGRRVDSRETAEDILQEVMLRIHRQAAEGKLVGSVSGWVHTIARNAITDHYRSARVRRELPLATDGELEPAAEPEEESDRRGELAACVTPLLRRLPAIYREALTLTEVEGLSQVEAAERLGLSTSGMKSRVQRARRLLKGVLVDCCEVELDRRRTVTDYRRRNGSCACG